MSVAERGARENVESEGQINPNSDRSIRGCKP